MRKSDFIAPMIPALVEERSHPRPGCMRSKHDGVRTVLVIDGGGIPAFTPRGNDWRDRYSAVVEAARKGSTASLRHFWHVGSRAGLTYAGKAMIAMSRLERDALLSRLQKLRRERPAPVLALPKAKAEWVKLEVNVRVRDLKGTEELRHASVRGLGTGRATLAEGEDGLRPPRTVEGRAD